MTSHIGLLLISLILVSKGIDFASCKVCKFERKYKCGIEDCNCRYASQNEVGGGLYGRLMAFISPADKVCDKCDMYCNEIKHINCQHGACDQQKGCICRDCWSGETCSKYRNRQPEFKERYYDSEIKENANVGDEILKVSAFDADLETCVDKKNCPCGRIKYSISMGNEDGLFNINADTGVISLAKKLSDQYHSQITLSILAENEADLNTVEDNQIDKPSAIVGITVTTDDDAVRVRRSLHHRTRRSVTTYDKLEITFEAETNNTFFPAGCTMNYRLLLTQNSSATPEALNSITVQFTSENLNLSDTYSVKISDVVKSTNTMIWSEGKVQFSISDPLPSDGKMEIKFSATVREALEPLALLQVAFTMNATASGAVTYGPKNSRELYTTYPIIKLARTKQGVVRAETTLDYNVNITLPYFNFTFVFEITTIVNDFRFLSIENVKINGISSSVQAEHQSPSPMMYTAVEDNITSRAVLDFGKIKVLNMNQSVNTIKLSFSVRIYDHHLLENSSIHWVGVGAHSGEEMLWVGQDALTFLKSEPYLYAKIKAMNNTNPTRYYIDDQLDFSWSVQHSENGSYENAQNVKILFCFSPSLDFVAITGLTSFNAATTSVEAGTQKKIRKYTLSGAFSLGTSFNGIIIAKVNNTVTPLANLNVEIRIEYQTSGGVDRPVRTYKPSPGYIAGVPSFNLSSNAPDRLVNIGQPVDITVTILLNKMVLKGKFYVILPVANSSAIMRFVPDESFKTKSVGTNIQVAPAFSNSEPTFNSTSRNTTYYDRGEIDLGQISNKAVDENALSSNEDNTVTLKFKVVLEENEHVKNRSNYKIGVGVKGSEQMIWISQMTFITNIALGRQPSLLIQSYTNASGSLVQGSVVEYNFTISYKDNSDAHAYQIQVIWMLPVYTKYLQVHENKHQLKIIKSGNNVVFSLSKLEFGERPTVSFSVSLDSEKTLKKSGTNYAVTPVSLTYQNNKGKSYYEPLVPMSVQFKVPEQPIQTPANAVTEFYRRGFLVDNSSSAVYICSVSSQRNRPSCFWTGDKGGTWRAVDVQVISIIGIDHANKMVYGVGNNMISYMKYIPNKGKWYSISHDQWEQSKSTLSDCAVVEIKDSDNDESEPATDKQKIIGNGEKWGATKTGVYHLPKSSGWKLKALWNSCH
ncbi:uncharacterized protein LOC114528690 [Dendronephthya gigantea]|uniref:uncharacterized protein LOC114528690 n=1 Tax=Dendronephthya gigantea TaxID=151771 RepID=UPI001069C8A7|nr:uncharacterized protein LOC114528690 [Dendronephthya gigantea]